MNPGVLLPAGSPETCAARLAQFGRMVRERDPAQRYRLTMEEVHETRRDQQNNTIRLWCGEIGRDQGLDPIEAHGLIKDQWLLPLRLTWPETQDKAVEEQADMDGVIGHPRYHRYADRFIRSSDLGVRRFTEYMDAVVIGVADEIGLALTVPDPKKARRRRRTPEAA